MGVWQRSPAGLAIARSNPELVASFGQALPDLHDDDVIGSRVLRRAATSSSRASAGREALATARGELAERGLGLILDYVPNHVAPDHPWTTEHPDYFIRESDGGELMNGKDPYFAPWPDVVQLNAFSPGLRTAATDTLISIAAQCDGVRCDMAMLMTNEVFARTWGARAGDPPAEDYWPAIITAVHAAAPRLRVHRRGLLGHGVDAATAGLRLLLRQAPLRPPRRAGPRSRCAATCRRTPATRSGSCASSRTTTSRAPRTRSPPEQSRAAAVVMSTIAGARLYHAGQLEGFHGHIPVFLARGPEQPADESLRAFYERLLGAVADSDLRDGDWQLCECSGWPDNHSAEQLVAWCWRTSRSRHLVIVNLAGQDAQARVRLPWSDLGGRTWQLRNRLDGGDAFERAGDELRDEGLYVAMRPWEPYLLEFTSTKG